MFYKNVVKQTDLRNGDTRTLLIFKFKMSCCVKLLFCLSCFIVLITKEKYFLRFLIKQL